MSIFLGVCRSPLACVNLPPVRVDPPWMGRSTLRFVAILLWSGRSALFPRTSGIKPPVLSKFLRVFRELFIKSFLNGVWGNAPNNALGRSKPEGLHHKNIGAQLRKGGLFDEKVRVSTHSFRNTDFMFALVGNYANTLRHELGHLLSLHDHYCYKKEHGRETCQNYCDICVENREKERRCIMSKTEEIKFCIDCYKDIREYLSTLDNKVGE